MKRRFVECAILLAVVISVVYMAQTQNGYGHSVNMHDPIFDINSNGNEVAQGEGSDPRGQSFHESNGSVIGYVWGKGWHYFGGLLNGATEAQTKNPNDPGHPNDQTDQMIYVIYTRADCYANPYTCRAEIDPSLSYVYALPERTSTFGGWGSISLEFSGVCYHEIEDGDCVLRERKETKWSGSQSIFVKVSLYEYTEKRSGSFGVGASGPIGSVTASYTHEFQEKHDDLRARGFGIKAKLRANPYDAVIYKQSKSASASGYIEGAGTGDLMASRAGVDDHECSGSGSQ